jgi:hypothetical protein
MLGALVVLAAFALATFTYFGVERLGWRALVPLVCRGVAWSALGLLLVNVSCPVAGTSLEPLVLLDASLSMEASGGRWNEARDSASRWGELRYFGDERSGSDSGATRGRSLLAPALLAASASDRPLIVVSDGEIEDKREIPPDLLTRSTIRVFPRTVQPDVAITRVTGPARVSAGDSISLEIEVTRVGGGSVDSVPVEVLSGTRRLARRTVKLGGASGGQTRIALSSTGVVAGDQLLRVTLPSGGGSEQRTDTRLHLVRVAETPGVVFLASPADWDSRFLYRTLREVTQLPVRGYIRLETNRWRTMGDLRPVPVDVVRRAARRADLLILKGDVGGYAQGSEARGILRWPSGETGETQLAGDWYLSQSDASPLAGAFLGQPVDSFPPSIALTPIQPTAGEWVALYAQLGRRGQNRPAITGRQDGRIRRVTVAVEGLWRWPFRGGSSEQSYRSWVAATASWLLGSTDPSEGVTRPIQAVVPNGRPIVFEWLGAGPPVAQPIVLSSPAGQTSDTLQFGGDGRATLWLTPGEYRYTLGGGATGLTAVEQYSEELLPRPIGLEGHTGRQARADARTTARDWLWLFALCVLALSGEWLARRRLGLR